jgi:hypothetical protein
LSSITLAQASPIKPPITAPTTKPQEPAPQLSDSSNSVQKTQPSGASASADPAKVQELRAGVLGDADKALAAAAKEAGLEKVAEMLSKEPGKLDQAARGALANLIVDKMKAAGKDTSGLVSKLAEIGQRSGAKLNFGLKDVAAKVAEQPVVAKPTANEMAIGTALQLQLFNESKDPSKKAQAQDLIKQFVPINDKTKALPTTQAVSEAAPSSSSEVSSPLPQKIETSLEKLNTSLTSGATGAVQ